MTIYRHHDNCFLTIYTHRNGVLRLGSNLSPNPITGCTFTKFLGNGTYAGNLQITLRHCPSLMSQTGGLPLESAVEDDDWIILSAGALGNRFDVTLALVDKVSRVESMRGGVKITEYVIVARDFGKVIDSTEVWFSEVGSNPNYAGLAAKDLVNYEMKGSPDTICKLLIDGFLAPWQGDQGMWQLPLELVADMPSALSSSQVALPGEQDGQPGIYSLLDHDTYVNPVRGAGVLTSVFNLQYGLSALLNEWSHPILNELFFDLRPDASGVLKPCMVLREKPFPVYREEMATSAWGLLPTVRIARDRLFALNVARSVEYRFNTFTLMNQMMPGSPVSQHMLYFPLMNAPSVRKHGLRRLELGTRFAVLLNDEQMDAEARRWIWLLHSWFGPAADLLYGSATLRGIDPDIKIGRKIVLSDDPLTSDADPNRETYYCEGVTLQWQPPPGGWITNLSLSRGYRGPDTVPYGLMQQHFDDLNALDPSVRVDPGPSTDYLGMTPTESLLAAREVQLTAGNATLLGRRAD